MSGTPGDRRQPSEGLVGTPAEANQRNFSPDGDDRSSTSALQDSFNYGYDNGGGGGHQQRLEGFGTRPLGFQVVAKLKRWERMRRHSSRRNMSHPIIGPRSNSASAAIPGPRSSDGEIVPLMPPTRVASEQQKQMMSSTNTIESVKEEEEEESYEKETLKEQLIQIVAGKAVSVGLLAAPVAWFAQYQQWNPAWIFWLNFIVLVPLAAILGDFTEAVADHTNQTIGGLINATFGNAVEVVVAIQALLADEIRVVQASMLGSIFSNLLLVLGCCFFFGGLIYKEQVFNSTAATANMGLLALSSIALVLPTPFAEYYHVEDESVLVISRLAAVFLMFMYLQLLIFQLKTHKHIFDEDDEEGDDPNMPMSVAIMGLLITTLLVTFFSEFLVQSIDGYCETSGVSRTFVGLILLPIVGNAVEHVTAVTVAMKDKMDLAMGVAVGSCTQISLFVVPLAVLVGWMLDKNMTLNFPHFEIILYILSVITVSICVSHPKGNWLEGSLLITTYLMIAVGFWFEKVVDFR